MKKIEPQKLSSFAIAPASVGIACICVIFWFKPDGLVMLILSLLTITCGIISLYMLWPQARELLLERKR